MAASPVTALGKKLGIKPGYHVLVLNAPAGYVELLAELPTGAHLATSADGVFDLVEVFVHDKAEVDSFAPVALRALKAGGLLWFAYPKKSARMNTDISRDVGWDVLTSAGFRIVSLIAIDDVWSAGRFRPVNDVKSK